MTSSNPYIQQLTEKGYIPAECRTTSQAKRQYPLTIGLRTFNSEEEYQEALADFINGH